MTDLIESQSTAGGYGEAAEAEPNLTPLYLRQCNEQV